MRKLAAMASAVAVMLGVPGAAQAARVPDSTATLCAPDAWKWADHGDLVLRNSVFGPGDGQCVTDASDGPGFTVTRSTTPAYAWNGFAWLYEGCWFGACSQKGPLPLRVSRIRSMTLHLASRYPGSQAGNDTGELWFSRTDTAGTHPDQMELMTWASWRGEKLHDAVLVRIGPRWWWLEDWRVREYGTSWQYVQLRDPADRPGDLAGVNMMPVLAFCERHHWISRSSWAMAAGAGFELVHHGTGDALTSFSGLVNGRP